MEIKNITKDKICIFLLPFSMEIQWKYNDNKHRKTGITTCPTLESGGVILNVIGSAAILNTPTNNAKNLS